MADLQRGQQVAYEYLIRENEDVAFESLSMLEQREELRAAVGLLVQFAYDALGQMRPGTQFPLMERRLPEMARRYGPWQR